MCGIAGYIGSKKTFPNNKIIKKCLNLMKKRGPDNQSSLFFNEKFNYLFCSSRLSVIDLNSRSNQPQEDEKGILVFNGEIYNYLEIKKKLKKKGIVFKTNSDTEVLLKYLNLNGGDNLTELDGMWSFAYYSKEKKTTLISRDKFGEKPLFFKIEGKNNLIFGSNINYIIELSKSKNKINEEKIIQFLRNGYREVFSNNETFFKNIYSISPGSSMIIDKNLNIKFSNYWKKSKFKPINSSLSNRSKKLKELISLNFKKSFRSDTSLAFLLSGGIDSSIIAYLSKSVKNKTKFFSYRSLSNEYDEKKNIDQIVKKLKLKHEYVYPNKNTNFVNLKNMIYDFGFPLMSSTYLAYAELCKTIKKQNYKVLISGNGGDEIFSGYYSHHMSYLVSTEKEKLFKKYIKDWEINTKPYIRLDILKNFQKFKNNLNPTFYEIKYYSKFFKEKKFKNFKKQNYEKDFFINHLNSDLFADSLPAQLHSIDNISMYHSVEARAPFLFQNLFDFRNKLKKSFFIRNGIAKYLLRNSFKNNLPKSVIFEKEKIGFYSTLNETINLKSKKIRNLISNCSFTKKYLNKNLIKSIIDSKNFNHQDEKFIFSLINIAVFLKKYR